MQRQKIYLIAFSFLLLINFVKLQYTFINDGFDEDEKQFGTITGDVQNWAALLQNYILQVFESLHCFFCFQNNFYY